MSAAKLAGVWLALLALLALSAASAWLPMGAWNSAINLGVAAAKALLIALAFMELHQRAPLPRLIALAALAFLAILMLLSGADFLTRHSAPAPWHAAHPWSQTR